MIIIIIHMIAMHIEQSLHANHEARVDQLRDEIGKVGPKTRAATPLATTNRRIWSGLVANELGVFQPPPVTSQRCFSIPGHPSSHFVQGIEGAVRQAARAREQPLIRLADKTGRSLPPLVANLGITAHGLDRRSLQPILMASLNRRAFPAIIRSRLKRSR